MSVDGSRGYVMFLIRRLVIRSDALVEKSRIWLLRRWAGETPVLLPSYSLEGKKMRGKKNADSYSFGHT